jgi:nucleoid-associated protein YgaU
MTVPSQVRARCAVVATGLAGAGWGAVTAAAHALPTAPPRTADDALVRLCLVALLLALAWGWLQAVAAVVQAWHGSTAVRHPGLVRRLVLVACGVAAVGALAGPAGATAPGDPDPDVLTGLPLPERAVGSAHGTGHGAGRTVVVRGGDTLWALAAAELGPRAGPAAVTSRWRLVYQRNRAAIGADPDLIRPGQLLRLPRLTSREPT